MPMSVDEEMRFVPKPVGCMRGRGNDATYDAEVAFGGEHRTVGTGYKSHNEAIASAQTQCDIMIAAMRKAALTIHHKWPKSKP